MIFHNSVFCNGKVWDIWEYKTLYLTNLKPEISNVNFEIPILIWSILSVHGSPLISFEVCLSVTALVFSVTFCQIWNIVYNTVTEYESSRIGAVRKDFNWLLMICETLWWVWDPIWNNLISLSLVQGSNPKSKVWTKAEL